MSGTQTPDLTLATALDEFIGNFDSGLGMETKRVTAANVALQIASLVNLPSAAGLVYATLADLNADLAHDANTRAEVVADATLANNGVYSKVGATGTGSWTKLADSITVTLPNRVTTLEGAAAPLTIAYQLPLVWDRYGVLGGAARTLYLPRTAYYKRGSVTENIVDAGSESAHLAGYTELALSSVASSVYLDASAAHANLYKVAVYPATIPTTAIDNIIVIADIWDDVVRTVHDLIRADDVTGAKRVFTAKNPMVLDGNRLLIPKFYQANNGGFVLHSPSDGSEFIEYTIDPSDTLEHRLYLDTVATGSSSTPTIRHVTGTTPPVDESPLYPMIARWLRGVVTAPSGMALITGEDFITSECPFGLDANRREALFGTTTIGAVTEANLLALGFSSGAVDVAGKRPFYGGYFPQSVKAGDAIFVRFYTQTDAANAFGAPIVYFWTAAGVNTGSASPTLEKIYSGGLAASWILRGPAPFDFDWIYAGADAGSGELVTICGLQYGSGMDSARIWIGRNDYRLAAQQTRLPAFGNLQSLPIEPDCEKFLCGPDIWLVKGRGPQSINVVNGFSSKIEGMPIQATLLLPPATLADSPYARSGVDNILLDADAMGQGSAHGVISLRRRGGHKDWRYEAPVTVHVAPATVTASKKILLIGDSLTNRQIAAFLGPKLSAIGVTPTFVGTMTGIGTDGGDTTGPLGEGREGWQWGDVTYQQTNFAAVPIGGEAAYLAAAKSAQRNANPFIVAGSGAGAYNGYKFDFGQYLSRFSIATPDYVWIALGQNDITFQGASALAQITAALGVIIPSIRSAAPSARIALTLHTRPRSYSGDAELAYRWGIIRELISYVAASGDSDLQLIPLWLQMSAEAGWGQASQRVDAATGLQNNLWADTIHFEATQRHVVAESIAAWIACREAGV